MPGTARTGSGRRKSSSSAGSTTSSPSGLPASEASFATSLVRPMPMETASPVSSRIRARTSAAAPAGSSANGPASRSTKASSMLSGSTSSDSVPSVAMMRREYAEYASNRGKSTAAAGLSRRARLIDIAERAPARRAS